MIFSTHVCVVVVVVVVVEVRVEQGEDLHVLERDLQVDLAVLALVPREHVARGRNRRRVVGAGGGGGGGRAGGGRQQHEQRGREHRAGDECKSEICASSTCGRRVVGQTLETRGEKEIAAAPRSLPTTTHVRPGG
jgi:hypothetical protein